jgi:hypothetical protein
MSFDHMYGIFLSGAAWVILLLNERWPGIYQGVKNRRFDCVSRGGSIEE